MSSTRERILAIAGDLFARQGFTGTTIADIARELGTTTAALYYHFSSKAEILGALLAEPLERYTEIIKDLDSSSATPENLLGAFVDLTASSSGLAAVIDRDPTVLAMIDQHLPRTSEEMIAEVIAVLAGPNPNRAAILRAHAAFAVIKGATQAALAGPEGALTATDRAEIIAAAQRALAP